VLRDGTVTVPLRNPDFFIQKNHNIFVTGLHSIGAGSQIKIKPGKNQDEEFSKIDKIPVIFSSPRCAAYDWMKQLVY